MHRFFQRLLGRGPAPASAPAYAHWSDHARECPRCDGVVPAKVSSCPACGQNCASDGPKLVPDEVFKALYEEKRYLACDQCQCQQRVYPRISTFITCEVCRTQLPQQRDVFPRLLVEPGKVRRPAGHISEDTECRACGRYAPTRDRLDAFYWTDFLIGGGPQTEHFHEPPWVCEDSLYIPEPYPIIGKACSDFDVRRRRETDTPDFTRTPGPSVPIGDAMRIERAIDTYEVLYGMYVEAMGEPPARVRCLYLKPCERCGEADPMGLEENLRDKAAPYLQVVRGRCSGGGFS